jgi:lipid II:glycine glycyltransferase (peptidoglycan interpeptide bridge formation enzyme)
VDFLTSQINLTRNIDVIENDFSKTTRYEINKSYNYDITCSEEYERDKFLIYYNMIAPALKIRKLSMSQIISYGSNILITKVTLNKKVICYHVYLEDREAGIARLLYSISGFRKEDKEIKKLYSMANRRLHYYDLCSYQNRGFQIYDFGGIGKKKELEGINKFKLSFGGEIVQYYNYIPIYLWYIKCIFI